MGSRGNLAGAEFCCSLPDDHRQSPIYGRAPISFPLKADVLEMEHSGYFPLHPLFSTLSMSTRHSFLSTTGLLRANSSASTLSTRQTNLGNTKVGSHIRVDNTPKTRKTVTRAGVVPLGPTFIIFIAFFFSFIFIFSISFAFVGSEDEETFKDLLNDIAHNSPGVSCILPTHCVF